MEIARRRMQRHHEQAELGHGGASLIFVYNGRVAGGDWAGKR
jgi:hypothetical protein